MVKATVRSVAEVLKYMKGRKSFDRVLEKVNVLSVTDGKISAELKIEEDHLNSMGILDSGLSTTIVDCITGYTLMTQIPGPHVSIDINMKYYDKVHKGATILIDGYIVKTGKTLAFLELEIKDKATGKVVVKGSHTKFVPTN